MKRLLLPLLCLNSACTTITFENGPVNLNTPVSQKWHHNFANGLFEGSDPVNLKQTCNGKNWQSVSTKLSPENAIAASVVNGFVPGVELWNPKMVEVRCHNTTTPPKTNES